MCNFFLSHTELGLFSGLLSYKAQTFDRKCMKKTKFQNVFVEKRIEKLHQRFWTELSDSSEFLCFDCIK